MHELWGAQTLQAFYRRHLLEDLLPFWSKAVDRRYGGMFTCFTNSGDERINTDKYTWSQGRYIWIWSRIARLIGQGVLPGDASAFRREAEQAADFLRRHVYLDNGNCAFLLTEDGRKKESVPGQGLDTSFYADCFVVLGLAELALLNERNDMIEEALALYDRIHARLSGGRIRSEPYPIPEGLKSHSVHMILLNISGQLTETLAHFRHPACQRVRQDCLAYAESVMNEFLMPDQRIAELLPAEPGEAPSTVLCRHVNPGHTLESMWFVIHAAGLLGQSDLAVRTLPVIRRAFELGWDTEHGGLLRFVDRDGGPPAGQRTGDPYETLIMDTWDSKLWWPHSEALYSTLLAYELAGEAEDKAALKELYLKTHEYVFRTFPQPDRRIGEWIQIRDRAGHPLDKVVALPVKDPFHIIRNVLLIIELYANHSETAGGGVR
ncbi:AGE family epimerase/isomerase [Paenibacillus doosanensis]|uniref:AGE family epimerase/isomerase n=1 Tax=Paenibacillus doosanensis TaxID=1229154 RepID=UPI0021800A8E|nr:AGE family epimerase/isomerase [Paenibacillus doosanensis]MCS7460979.1 AGE family epimerase/isomerase [Paenibacillus doosanensis]